MLLGSRSAPALTAGKTNSGSVTLVLPLDLSVDAYYVIAVADGDNTILEGNETNNSFSRPLTLSPDLQLPALASGSATGAGRSLPVTDTTSNTGSGDAPASATKFYLSRDAAIDAGDVVLGSRAVPALTAGSTSSGATTLTIPAETAVGSYYLIAAVDADGAMTELSETNNTRYQNLVVENPDLQVSSLSFSSPSGAGRTLSVTDTTANTSAGDSFAPTTTKLYLSGDRALDADDILLGSRSVPVLAAGKNSIAATSVTIPAGTPAGAYYLLAVADADEAVTERSEANNVASQGLTIENPDLQISGLSVAAGAGRNMTVTDTTWNSSAGDAGASTTKLYFSSDTTVDADDILLASRAVGALAAGRNSAATTSVTIPAGTPAGTYYVIAVADADGAVTERSEANNTLSRSVIIRPDLQLPALASGSATGAGRSLPVTDTTSNTGSGDAPASATKFYLSRDAAIDAGDVVLGSRAVPALTAGSTSSGATTLTIPAETAVGSYYLIAAADADGAMTELSETNNTRYQNLVVENPDLQVSSVSFSSPSGAGRTLSVTDTTANTSAGDSFAPTTTKLYLSGDRALDADDILLGSRSVPVLAAGKNSIAATSVTIPAGTPAGAYYLLAVADADEAVTERSEANNVASQGLTIENPDLQISGLSVAAGAGRNMTVTDTTWNSSAGDAGASTTKLYFSSDTTMDADDILLASRAVGALAAGRNSAATTSVTIPAGTPAGTYYVIAVADGDGTVTERSEANNTLSRSVIIRPDIQLPALASGSATGAGRSLPVTDTTSNTGSGDAPASATKFYLSPGCGDRCRRCRAGQPCRAGPDRGKHQQRRYHADHTGGNGSGELLSHCRGRRGRGNDRAERDEQHEVPEPRRGEPGPQVSSLSFSSPSGAGRTLSVTDTTANTSAGDSFAPTTTKLYLSGDRALDADDILLGSRSVPVLAAGKNSIAATSVTIPAGTPAGAYYLLAVADADEAVTERSEANNVASQGLTIENPDLQISGLSVAAGAGRNMTVTDTTWNSSAGDAGASTTKLYFSSDTTVDADDILLASRAVGALAAGRNSAATTSVTIPAGTPAGTYYVIAVADADGTVTERSEANNTLSRSVIIRPDLQLSALSFASPGTPGMSLSIKETTGNVSIGDADASITRFYLSRDAAIDAGDVVVGSRVVPALAAGTSSIGDTTVTIPAETPAGTYYIIAMGDADKSVPEGNELNNIMYRAIVISP